MSDIPIQRYGVNEPSREVTFDLVEYGGQWQRGMFARSIEQRGTKLQLMTVRDGRHVPVGRAVSVEDVGNTLRGVFRVDDTPAGDAVLAAARADNTTLTATLAVRQIDDREAALTHVFIGGLDAPRSDGPRISRAVAERRLRLLELEGR